MKFIPVVAVLLFVYCQTDIDCKSGDISIGTLQKTQGNKSVSNLPSEFNYTTADMKKAILGSWLNKNGDTVFTTMVGQDSKISFTVGTHNSKCGPTLARMSFYCTSTKTIQATNFTGTITFYESTNTGEVQINISEKIYNFSHFKNTINSCYAITSFINIPELALVQGDTLTMCLLP